MEKKKVRIGQPSPIAQEMMIADEEAMERLRKIMGLRKEEIVPQAVQLAYSVMKRGIDRVSGRKLTDEALAAAVAIGTIKRWFPDTTGRENIDHLQTG